MVCALTFPASLSAARILLPPPVDDDDATGHQRDPYRIVLNLQVLLLTQPLRCAFQVLQAARVPAPPPDDDGDDDRHDEQNVDRISRDVMRGDVVLHNHVRCIAAERPHLGFR